MEIRPRRAKIVSHEAVDGNDTNFRIIRNWPAISDAWFKTLTRFVATPHEPKPMGGLAKFILPIFSTTVSIRYRAEVQQCAS